MKEGCQIIGDHCCTFISQGDENLTIVVEHLKELSSVLEREHQPDTDWNPLVWVLVSVWCLGNSHFPLAYLWSNITDCSVANYQLCEDIV